MTRYYKTTGLYDMVDLLQFKVVYDKSCGGYIAQLTPCYIDKYGIVGMYYCPEYYKYFGTQFIELVQVSRRSKKKETEAEQLVEKEDVINTLLDHYITYAEHMGKHFEIIGELEELRK